MVSLIVLAGLDPEEEREFTQILFEWIPVGKLHVDVAFLVDPLSMAIVVFVTGIAAHPRVLDRVHARRREVLEVIYMNLFVFAMLMLVLGDNLVITFLGWEGVGACSSYSSRSGSPRGTSIGKKAFVTNRIGDFGSASSSRSHARLGRYLVIDAEAETLATVTATTIALLFFLGAPGKSAQLPFVGLVAGRHGRPDPGVRPDPRRHDASPPACTCCAPFARGPPSTVALNVIVVVGTITALWAATVASAQHDMEPYAYSTVSQLGFMVVASRVSGLCLAIFHMITHTCFKALLFLGAGSVIHGLHGEQDLRRMGHTQQGHADHSATFIVGWLTIRPPRASGRRTRSWITSCGRRVPALSVVVSISAFLTAYYMSRLPLTFFGEAR